ncbi:MAG TPA: TrmB family transcriptional regulator, partial [Hydrogenothermaceae bacterium]|nr:TrmB family transcriptional regulator [Hydrogenothermaceae bacterium]
MEISEKVLAMLTRLGFTKYEVLTYWTLLVYGPSTAKEISEKSGIPYNRVYD